MENLEKIKEELKTILSEKRYTHSIGVMKRAKHLAKIYGIDPDVAELTGLTHDMGKELSEEEKLNYVRENNIDIDEVELHNVGLLHGKIGADMAKKKYAFNLSMQKAIMYHTTAYPEMDMLAKIIYVADKTDETRNYKEVKELQEISERDLDSCILMILEYDIKKNIEDRKLIHPNSILTWNSLLIKKS